MKRVVVNTVTGATPAETICSQSIGMKIRNI